MNTFKITWSNRDTTITGFNGTLAEAIDYYCNHRFNIGGNVDKGIEVFGHAVNVEQI